MKCLQCGEENKDSAKFCKQCGNEIYNESHLGSVDLYFNKKNNSCQTCKNVAPELRHIVFYQNIGKLIEREYASVDGMLCKKCIDSYFWKYTLTTLLLGWWGMISFCITPFILLNNVFRYLFTLNMKTNN